MGTDIYIPMSRPVSRRVYLWTAGLLLTGVLWFLLLQSQFHLLMAIIITTSLLAISGSDKSVAIALTFAYLFSMGDLRRVITMVAPQPAFDPMLLVSPIMAALLALPLLLHLRLKENLSKAMFALLVIMSLEVVNPSQGGLAVGLSGAFFYIVPMLWFWVGRAFASPALVEQLLYRVVVPLATLAALLGLG